MVNNDFIKKKNKNQKKNYQEKEMGDIKIEIRSKELFIHKNNFSMLQQCLCLPPKNVFVIKLKVMHITKFGDVNVKRRPIRLRRCINRLCCGRASDVNFSFLFTNDNALTCKIWTKQLSLSQHAGHWGICIVFSPMVRRSLCHLRPLTGSLLTKLIYWLKWELKPAAICGCPIHETKTLCIYNTLNLHLLNLAVF